MLLNISAQAILSGITSLTLSKESMLRCSRILQQNMTLSTLLDHVPLPAVILFLIQQKSRILVAFPQYLCLWHVSCKQRGVWNTLVSEATKRIPTCALCGMVSCAVAQPCAEHLVKPWGKRLFSLCKLHFLNAGEFLHKSWNSAWGSWLRQVEGIFCSQVYVRGLRMVLAEHDDTDFGVVFIDIVCYWKSMLFLRGSWAFQLSQKFKL